jgi:hypothetical protein
MAAGALRAPRAHRPPCARRAVHTRHFSRSTDTCHVDSLSLRSHAHSLYSLCLCVASVCTDHAERFAAESGTPFTRIWFGVNASLFAADGEDGGVDSDGAAGSDARDKSVQAAHAGLDSLTSPSRADLADAAPSVTASSSGSSMGVVGRTAVGGAVVDGSMTAGATAHDHGLDHLDLHASPASTRVARREPRHEQQRHEQQRHEQQRHVKPTDKSMARPTAGTLSRSATRPPSTGAAGGALTRGGPVPAREAMRDVPALSPLAREASRSSPTYEYDLGFTGVIRHEQTNNWRYQIWRHTWPRLRAHGLRLYSGPKGGVHVGVAHAAVNLSVYVHAMRHSKMWLSTTGPADLVRTRARIPMFDVSPISALTQPRLLPTTEREGCVGR